MARSTPVPPWLLALDGLGAVLLALGILGAGADHGSSGLLADPALAWSLIAVGGALLLASLAVIVARLVRSRR